MSFVSSSIAGSALIGGGALASGVLGYLGSTSAAKTQADAANNALNFQESAFNTNQANFKPYINAGNSATYTLGNLLGLNGGTGSGGSSGNNTPDYSSFFNSPDYNFAQSQGQRGVINGANAQGIGLSGGTLKDLATFNSGLASQQYGNYFNRLMGLSSQGANPRVRRPAMRQTYPLPSATPCRASGRRRRPALSAARMPLQARSIAVCQIHCWRTTYRG